MGVHRKSGTGLNDVFIVNEQEAMMGVLRIMVLTKTETVPGIKPMRLSIKTVFRAMKR